MKRFIDSILLMSGCILFTACNPSTEFATFDPANAKDLKDKDINKSILSNATSGVSAEDLAVVDVVYFVDNSNTIIEEQQNLAQVAQNLVTNLSGSSISIEIETSATTTQAIQISDGNTDIISEETITEIEVLLTQLDQDGYFDSLITTPPSIVNDPFVCPTETTVPKKVNVCHKTPNHRHDIQVSVNAVPAMSARGDFIGTCALQDLVTTCGGLGVNLVTMECNLTPVEEVVTPNCADLSSVKKVTVCHQASGNRHDISVSVNAVPAHSAHGDFIGTCALQDLVTTCGAAGVNLGTLTCN